MVIDFRTRPPYKSFVTKGNFFPRPMEDDFERPEDVPGIYRDSIGIESARHGDFRLYMDELSASGIDMQVVQGRKVRPGMAAVDNEDVCRLQMLYPKQFISFPAVDPADVDGAVAEIEYYVKTYGIKGIAMEPGWSMPPVYVDDRKLDPVYAACEEHGLICAFTLSVLAGEDLSYCNPIAVQHTALRFPRVAFTVSHGCWPFVRAANSFMRYRMMFATSYPVRPLKQSLEQFRTLPFEPEVLELLLHENAERLLGLNKS